MHQSGDTTLLPPQECHLHQTTTGAKSTASSIFVTHTLVQKVHFPLQELYKQIEQANYRQEYIQMTNFVHIIYIVSRHCQDRLHLYTMICSLPVKC